MRRPPEDTAPAEVSIHDLIDQFMADLADAVAVFADDDLTVYELIAAACPGESQRLDLFVAFTIKEYNARSAPAAEIVCLGCRRSVADEPAMPSMVPDTSGLLFWGEYDPDTTGAGGDAE